MMQSGENGPKPSLEQEESLKCEKFTRYECDICDTEGGLRLTKDKS